jgi:hypothetical protein
MEFYSSIKKNEILLKTGKWIKLKNIILNEVSQVQKDMGHMILSYVKDRSNTNTSIIYIYVYMLIYIYIHIYSYTH